MDTRQHQIAVLYATNSEVQLLTELLSDTNYAVVSYDGIRSLIGHEFDSELSAESTSDGFFAVLICADKPILETVGGADLFASKFVQLTGRCKRIIVLSASMDESTVCTYLSAGAHHVLPISDSPTLMHARLTASLRQHNANDLAEVAH